MKKLIKTTVMLLLFLGIVLTTNAQKTKTYKYYTFAIAELDSKAEKGDRYHIYFSPIISRTYIYRINNNNNPTYDYFNKEGNEIKDMWLKECKIRYDKKGEHWDWDTRVVIASNWRGGGEDVAKEATSCWSSTKKGAYKMRQRYILDFKNHYSIDYKVYY